MCKITHTCSFTYAHMHAHTQTHVLTISLWYAVGKWGEDLDPGANPAPCVKIHITLKA